MEYIYLLNVLLAIFRTSLTKCKRVYPEVSGLAAWSEN